MEEARRDAEMWVSVLLLGAAGHPVSLLLGLHSVPLLPSICGCQPHGFFLLFFLREGGHALIFYGYSTMHV